MVFFPVLFRNFPDLVCQLTDLLNANAHPVSYSLCVCDVQFNPVKHLPVMGSRFFTVSRMPEAFIAFCFAIRSSADLSAFQLSLFRFPEHTTRAKVPVILC